MQSLKILLAYPFFPKPMPRYILIQLWRCVIPYINLLIRESQVMLAIKLFKAPKILFFEKPTSPMTSTHSNSTGNRYPSQHWLPLSEAWIWSCLPHHVTLGRQKFQGITCPRSHKESGVQQDKETFPIQETTQPPSSALLLPVLLKQISHHPSNQTTALHQMSCLHKAPF